MQLDFEVVIVGGSYAGLSAAMALGRSHRKVLVVDGGKPCNIQTPFSHNFLLHDGEKPLSIATKAREQLVRYPSVQWRETEAVQAWREGDHFVVRTLQGESIACSILLFATGITDVMPAIDGFAACWGISVLHCPYCHGYEVSHRRLGALGKGEAGFQLARLISNWSSDLTLFTDGPSELTDEQANLLAKHSIRVVEQHINAIEHQHGQLSGLHLADGTHYGLGALFARPVMKQHCLLPELLGCELTEQGLIRTDEFHRTTVKGLYAAGDAMSMFRAVSVAVAAGTKAGAVINKDLIDAQF